MIKLSNEQLARYWDDIPTDDFNSIGINAETEAGGEICHETKQ